MRRLSIVLTVLCVAAVSVGAFAAKRGNSEGAWRTGSFSDPAYVTRWGYGDSNGAPASGTPKPSARNASAEG
jgi:hypothetical protein